MDASRWGFACVLACPPCTAGLFLAIGALFGVTAAIMKGALLVAALTLVAALWIRNAWLRRDEAACRLPARAPVAPED